MKHIINRHNAKTKSQSCESVPTNFEVGCLIAVRLCIAAFALLAATAYASYFKVPLGSSFYSVYTPIAWLFGICLLSTVWLAWRKTGLVFTYLQFLSDCILLIVTVWITGQIFSPILFLLIPVVAGAGLIAGKKAALAITAAAGLLYAGLLIAIYTGYLPLLDGSYQDYLTVGPASYFYMLAGLWTALIATALGADYIRRLAFAGHKLATQSQQKLLELEQSSIALINDLSESIVTTDLEDRITFLNQAAEQLLQIARQNTAQRASGLKFAVLMQELFPENSWTSGQRDHETTTELFGRHGNSELHIRLCAKPIINTAGELTGWLYTMQDISHLREMESQLEWQNKLSQLESYSEKSNEHPSTLVSDFVGETPIMQKIFRIISKVASSNANILISGESGTGKELVARSLHKGSTRRLKAFVAVNCGAIPENLIESQLFGHKKGSFTGADRDHKGFFLEADGGTMFLDEIGELPLSMQSKLLRVIQEKVVRPVGGDRDIPVDVRLISASNRQLNIEVGAGRFREDLFYRLNVISICMPPLKDRMGDLPLLINSLLKRHKKADKLPVVTPAAAQMLMQYDYPGNIRELENILERAIVLGGEVILPEHLPEYLQKPTAVKAHVDSKSVTEIIIAEDLSLPLDLDQLLSGVEKKYMEVALVHSRGIKKDAAALLGMNFRSFRYRLQKYDIDNN